MKEIVQKISLPIVAAVSTFNVFAAPKDAKYEFTSKEYEQLIAQAVETLRSGIVLMESGRLREAEEKFLYVQERQFPKLIAVPADLFVNLNLNLGFVAARRPEYEKALEHYFVALAAAKNEKEWFKETKYVKSVLYPANFSSDETAATVLISIALAYDNTDRTPEAMRYYLELINIQTRRNDRIGVAEAWRYVGLGAQRRNDWISLGKAGSNILTTLKGQKGAQALEIDALLFLTQACANTGKFDEAKAHISRAIALERQTNDPRLPNHLDIAKSLEPMK